MPRRSAGSGWMPPRYKYERSISMEHQSLESLASPQRSHRSTMKLFIVACLAVSCYADVSLLAPRQRPPQGSYSSGGGDFLSAPRHHTPTHNQYIPPTNQYLPPTNQYLPPQQPPPQQPHYLPPPVKTTQKPPTQYLPPSKPNTYLPPTNTYLPAKGPTTPPVPILKQINELHADGSYKYETLTGDQTHIEQMGHIENLGTDHEEQVMHGSYSYVGDDGKTYTVTYVADSNGFRAIGDHLPTPPPIPAEIQKALDLNAAQEAQGYPSGRPDQGYPSGRPDQGYPSGRPDQGYPPSRPDQTYLPPTQTYLPPTQTNRPGYHY